MSDNDQKSGKVIRASSGSTRLTAGGGGPQGTTEAPRTQAAPVGSGPAGASGAAGSGPAATSGQTAAASTATQAAPRTSAPAAPTGRPSGGSQSSAGQTGSAPTSVSSGGTRLSAGSGTQRVTAARADDTEAIGSGPVRASSAGVKMGDKAKKKGPRTVRLTVAKLDPWSVMKMSFLLSVAIGIATVVAGLVLWLVLQATGTLSSMQSTLAEIAGTEGADQLLGLFSLGRVLSFSVLLALVNVVLITALSTLFAFLYNIGASIVGGFHLTLTDD